MCVLVIFIYFYVFVEDEEVSHVHTHKAGKCIAYFILSLKAGRLKGDERPFILGSWCRERNYYFQHFMAPSPRNKNIFNLINFLGPTVCLMPADGPHLGRLF